MSMNNETDEIHARIRHIHSNVIETIFCPLPDETKARQKEQNSRRKYKDKVISNYPGQLIVDSIGQISAGKEKTQYTNAILVTETLKWWKNKITELYKEKYTQEVKDISHGDQIIWKHKNGTKFLTFSFYPSKQKVMAQGTHNDVKTWIDHFRPLAEENSIYSKEMAKTNGKDSNNVKQQIDASENEQNTSEAQLDEAHNTQDSVAHSEANVPVSSDPNEAQKENGSQSTEVLGATAANVTAEIDQEVQTSHDTSMNEPVMFYTPEPLDSDLDKTNTDVNDSILNFKLKTPPLKFHRRSIRRDSRQFLIQSTSRKDSQRLLNVKHKLEALDGIVAGLQGGLQQLVANVHEHTSKTDQAISKMTELILKNFSTTDQNAKTDKQSTNSAKEINQLRDSVGQLQNVMTKRLNKISDEMKELDTKVQNSLDSQKDLKKLATVSDEMKLLDMKLQNTLDLQRDSKNTIIETIQSETEHVTSTLTTQLETRVQQLNKQIDTAGEKIRLQVARSQQTSVIERSTAQQTATNSVNPTVEIRSKDKSDTSTHKNPRTTETADSNGTSSRKILLIGDSTMKNVDKRQVIQRQTVSKCRASTIAEAHFKITTGSSHAKEKIVYCVGLNDLRHGSSAAEVTTSMEQLLHETDRRHPGCKIYICSILPVKCTDKLKNDIKQVNGNFARLSTTTENVFYVDILSKFISHKFLQDLFERDQTHPNDKGTLVMTACIRQSLQLSHKPPQQFTSRLVNSSNMSYAECVAPKDDNQSLPQASQKPSASLEPYPYGRTRTFHPWWPPGNYPPNIMPVYPPAFSTGYPYMYSHPMSSNC